MPLYICPAVAVDKVINIGPESFSLPLTGSNGEVQIMPPSAHTGIAPVNTRLISAQCRSGQVYLASAFFETKTCQIPCLLAAMVLLYTNPCVQINLAKGHITTPGSGECTHLLHVLGR